MAVISVVLIFFNFGIFLYQVALVQPWNCDPPPSFPERTPLGILSGITGIMYAFGGHGLYPELMREMKEPERWRTVVMWTFGIVVPMYFAVGLLGYYSYGGNARANINLNYPRNTANLLSLVAQTIQEAYFVVVPALVVLLQAELALKVDPTVYCKRLAPEAQRELAVESAPLQDWQPSSYAGMLDRTLTRIKAEQENESEEIESRFQDWRHVLSMRSCGVPPVLFRFIFRSLFLVSQAGIAILLLGGDGDILLSIQSLAGAIGFAALTYFLPLFFGWMMLPPPSGISRVLQVVSFVICVGLMLVGVYFEIQWIIEAAGGFTTDVPCKITPENFTGTGCEAAVGIPELPEF